MPASNDCAEAIVKSVSPSNRLSQSGACAMESPLPYPILRFAAELDLRSAALVDGLAERHFIGDAAAGELRRRPSHGWLAVADDGRLMGDQRSVAPELRRHRRLARPTRRRTDGNLLVQAAALAVEADPAGPDGDLLLSAIGKAVQHGHVAAEHPAAFQRINVALGPALGRQGRLGRLAPLQAFPQIVLTGGKLGLEVLFNVSRVVE